MQFFGKINEANIVLNVLSLGDDKLLDNNGVKQESIGQAYLESVTGWPANQWIWANGVRKNPMGVGLNGILQIKFFGQHNLIQIGLKILQQENGYLQQEGFLNLLKKKKIKTNITFGMKKIKVLN